MSSFPKDRSKDLRRGVVLGLVLFVGIILLLAGLAMISQSQGLLLNGADSKQRIKARIAAETQATLQIAAAMEKTSLLYGTDMSLPGTSLATLPTGDGLKGSSTVDQIGMVGGVLTQELITSGQFKGFLGLKLGYLVHATGYAPGGAKSQVDVELKVYQIPIYQYGVFYNGNLEINPGSDMNVAGPVHTNGMALFRSSNSFIGQSVRFQGPVTVAGQLYQWQHPGTNGKIKYRITPSNSVDTFQPNLLPDITAATSADVPPEINNTRNVKWGVDSIKLPIETNDPRQLLMPASASDPNGLSRQKYANKASATSRWINPGNGSGRPSWITGNGANTAHRVFWDRREQAWVRYWNFDVAALIASGNKDSIFYIADTFNYGIDKGLAHKQTLNAFRIVNASKLPRNMTIASPNTIYILGNFNTSPTVGCHDQTVAGPPGGDYCNAMIASDALTLLSPKWDNYKRANLYGCQEDLGTLDQGSENPLWTMGPTTPELMNGAPYTSSALPPTDNCGRYAGTITVNAAIMTGNKASPLSALPPLNTNAWAFEGGYEGGWHNTIRFLEDLAWSVTNFNGSFVCMWEAASRGLRLNGKVFATLPGGYYLPPTRNWGFDPRFASLVNMPPATPYLASQPITTWKEVR